MAINNEFSHEKLSFSIAMLVYQRVIGIVCAFEYPATNGQYQRFAQEVPASEKSNTSTGSCKISLHYIPV